MWIEGIGVEDGDLLRPGCSTDVSGLDTQDKLVYVKGPDGNIEYETSDAVNDPCYSGIEEVDRDDDIVIIRNGRNLEIAVNDTKFRMIELVDISGRMVWCEYLDGRGKIVLSTADYPRGIYVIVLSSNEDRITLSCYILIPEKIEKRGDRTISPSFCVSSFIYFISLAK